MLRTRLVARRAPHARVRIGKWLTQTYSTIPNPNPKPALPPPPKRKAVVPRLLFYTAAGALVFYGGSVALSKRTPAYRDFFVRNVYGGDALVRYFDKHTLADLPAELRHVDLEHQVSHAARQVRHGLHRVSDYVAQQDTLKHAREDVAQRTAQLQHTLHEQLDELRAKAEHESAHLLDKANDSWKDAREHLSDAREHLGEHLADARDQLGEHLADARDQLGEHWSDAREQLGKTAEDVRERFWADERVARAKAALGDAMPDTVKEHAYQSFGVGELPPPGLPTYGAPYRERKLVAPKDHGGARLRADPQAPKLPQLATSTKGAEPVVAQLAGTIDELTKLVAEAPNAGAAARGVLESAQVDLQQLSRRLDEIKKRDAQHLDAELAKQARAFEAQLEKAAAKAKSELGDRDATWTAKVDQLQSEQAAQFKTHLLKELETQREIIDARLKEEVLARAVELERKWKREIKAKVEEERAGRLARLEELATELENVEKLSMANAQSLDETIGWHTFNGALRTLRETMDGQDAVHDTSYTRRTFAPELQKLRETAKAKDNELIGAALTAIDESGAAQEGVESLATLHEWFSTRLAPRLTSVALMPEQGAGVLSYVGSWMLSPFLFVRKGNVPGGDVASTVARADWFLERRDLDSATREINHLRGWAKILAQDWLAAARLRLEVDQAVDLIDKEAAFASLLHT